MECLWSAPSDVSAPELRDELRDGELALTTVYTVLTRLEHKGFVAHDDGRPRRYRASASRADHAASVMREVLAMSSDRDAVLTRFVGTVSPEEARLLRRLLRKHPEAPPPDQG